VHLAEAILTRRPSPVVAWIQVGIYALFIFATLPVAPYITDFFERLFGFEEAIGSVASVVLAGVGAWVFVRLLRRARATGTANILWFLAVALAYALLLRRMEVAAEKVHFIEYGLLGLGCYRAWRRSDRDAATPLAAILVAYCIGLMDESIQYLSPWHTWWGFPKRTGEIQDALTNLWAIGLAQILAWRFLDHEAACILPSPRSIRHLGGAAAVTVGATCAFTLWTAEFGYRYVDPVAGTFFSRMTMEDLRRVDRDHGLERGEILRRHRETPYGDFVIKLYPAAVDPFMHEVRVHIFRRDRYLRKRNDAIGDPATRTRAHQHGVVSQREDDLLRTYFPATLAASGCTLSTQERAWVDESDRKLDHPSYESAVSNRIIVALSRHELASLTPVAVLAVVLLTIGATRWVATRQERAR